MNYPVWQVPYIGSGLVIAMIAITHVMISHFAIGGGFFLPMAEAKALREGNREWLVKLQGYSKFFLILTGVVGAMTGVGIWFSIGLASPSGTSLLIHNFVFGWAIEWVIFMVELTFAAAYYYTWDRIPERLHLRIGIVYGIVSYFTLVIINGILTFMLTPGSAWLSVAGTGNESSMFFQGFFNPTYWPSLALRTLVCIALAGIYALLVFSRIDGYKEGKFKSEMIRWASKWLLPAFFLMPFCLFWYLWNVPASQRELMSLGISTIGAGVFTQITRTALIALMGSATIGAVIYFLAYQNPRGFKFGHALAIFILTFLVTGSTEGVREMLRKPYVINQFMYSNGTRRNQVTTFNTEGYFTHSPWAAKGATPTDPPDQDEVGRRMFLGQCMSCHTIDGYRSMRRLLQGRDDQSIGNILQMLHDHKADSPYSKFMPPLVGTPDEIAALQSYLGQLVDGF
jgi:cytochrome bd-type quinol oxidase subunit 1